MHHAVKKCIYKSERNLLEMFYIILIYLYEIVFVGDVFCILRHFTTIV